MNEKATIVHGAIKYEARKAIIFNKESKILLIKLDLTRFNFLGGEWEVPGGRKTIGESDEDTINREVMEETGLRTEIIKPLDEWVVEIRNGPYASILEGKTYLCKAVTTNVELNDPEEQHIGYKWTTLSQALRMKIPKWLKQSLVKLKESRELERYQQVI